jgi:hypothetical protein
VLQEGNTSLKGNIDATPSFPLQRSFQLSHKKSSTCARGTTIPIPQVQDQQVHRVTVGQSHSLPRVDKTWSGSFSRSLIPISKSPEKTRSHLPLPVSPTKAENTRFQLSKSFAKPNLSSLFSTDHQPSAYNPPAKPSNSPLKKAKAPVLQTQLRAEERCRKVQVTNMAKNTKNRNKKNRNDEANATENETCSSPTNITGSNDTPSDVGGAVQSPVVAAPSSDVCNADKSIPPIHPLDPPETFAPKEPESTISSPATFHSAYGSPRSNSTTSQVFDYAPTGLEFSPTSMIQEKPLDFVDKKEDRPLDVMEALESIAKKKEVFLQSVAAEASVQTAFFQPGTRGGFVHDSPAHQQGIRAQPNTPVGAGQTAYAASDDSGQRPQAGTRAQAGTPVGVGQAESGGSGRRPGDAGGHCQNEANGIPKCRDRDPDQDDDEQEGGPSSSRIVASSLAVPNSGRGGRTTRTSQSPPVYTRTVLPRLFLPFNDIEGIETITFGKAVAVPASTPSETFERDVNTGKCFDHGTRTLLTSPRTVPTITSKSRSVTDKQFAANFNCLSPPTIVVTEPTLSEDGDESDMSTIVPDDHPQHVTDGDGANTQNISSCVDDPGDAEHNPQQPQAKKKSKKKKKADKKTDQGDDVVAVVTEDMAAVNLEPRPKPNVRMLLAKDTPAVIGDPPKAKYGTTAFISPGEGVYWRPGNWKWDREPTPTIYVDGATVERVTGIHPAQDVGPTSLSETAQGKQKVSACHPTLKKKLTSFTGINRPEPRGGHFQTWSF